MWSRNPYAYGSMEGSDMYCQMKNVNSYFNIVRKAHLQ